MTTSAQLPSAMKIGRTKTRSLADMIRATAPSWLNSRSAASTMRSAETADAVRFGFEAGAELSLDLFDWRAEESFLMGQLSLEIGVQDAVDATCSCHTFTVQRTPDIRRGAPGPSASGRLGRLRR